jgi:hypothetical protein
MKKTEAKKSRTTVPLNTEYKCTVYEDKSNLSPAEVCADLQYKY